MSNMMIENSNTNYENSFYKNENVKINILSNLSIIKLCNKTIKQGNAINKLAFSFYYVYEDENVLEVANEVQTSNNIYAIGVVDHKLKIKGIVIRKDFFDILGKPYGRDIFKNKKISYLMTKAVTFHEDLSIIMVAEILKNELREIDNKYFILTNDNLEFSGIFSTKNLLIYLSDITQRELEFAENIQKRIVAEDEHILQDNIEFFCYSKMAKGVGGDFYTVKKINENKWISALCDVSGKGISASLIASLLGGVFNIYDFNKGIKHFVKLLNKYISNTFKLEKFITGLLIELDEKKQEIILCDMGHSHFFLCRDGKILSCNTNEHNIPFGIEEDFDPIFNKLKICKDDIIFIYSDGVIEQTNNLNNDYTINRLKKLLKHHIKEDVLEIKQKIINDIEFFKNNQPQQDDITFIIIKIK